MNSLTRRICILSVSSIAVIHPAGGYAAALTGTYERKDGRDGGGSMTIEENAGSVRLTVQIGGIPNRGATQADCGFIAEGKIIGGIFSGKVTRQNVLADLSPQGDAAAANLPAFTASVKQNSIRSKTAASEQYCGGSGYSLDGDFVRKN